jgi:DNA (cytosine-5)-methyltransferase 1
MKTQLSNPTPVEVRAAREAAGLTQAAAGAVVHVDLRSWQRWESGERSMSPAHWELFQIKTRRARRA